MKSFDIGWYVHHALHIKSPHFSVVALDNRFYRSILPEGKIIFGSYVHLYNLIKTKATECS